MKKAAVVLAAFSLIASPAYAQTNLGASASVTNPQRSGDATTGLFSPAAGAVSVSSSGTERMRITATGVGIGTTVPFSILNVDPQGAGTILLGDTFTGHTSLQLTITAQSGGYSALQSIQASGSAWGNLNLNASGGNVGIGTTSPQNLLDVNGAASIGYNVAAPSNGLTVKGNVGVGTTAPTAGTALDLSYNTNSMLLPVGTTAQRPTAVNGMMRYNNDTPGIEAYYSGSWNTLGAGSATPGAMILLATATASSSASISFTSIPPGYDAYVVTLANIVPATNGDQLYLQMGETGGCTLETSNYHWFGGVFNSSGSSTNGSNSDTQIDITFTTGGVVNTSGLGVSGSINFYSLGSSSTYKQLAGNITYLENGGFDTVNTIGARYTGDTNPVTCLKFYMSTGNISSGQFALYGLKSS